MYYKLGRAFFRLLFRLVFRFRVEGRARVPSDGGVLLVANHASLFDPPLVGSSVQRQVNFMAKAELFRLPFLSWALPRVGAFPVARGAADRSALRKSIDLLNSGEVVGLFPEGTRTKTGELQKPLRGAGLVALRTNVPVIPVALIGTFKPFRTGGVLPSRFVVRIGSPLRIADLRRDGGKGAMEEASRRMLAGIANLLEEEKGQEPR